MEIRKTEEGDLPQIFRIFEEARASLRGLGIDQWQDGYPRERDIRRDMENGVSRVVTENGRVIATAAVYVGHEPAYDGIYDGKWRTESQIYGIVHRIAVSSEARGKNVAGALFDYCAGLAVREGVRSLRCDTHRGNTVMRHTLEKNGYALCGTVRLLSGAERVAYEKLL